VAELDTLGVTSGSRGVANHMNIILVCFDTWTALLRASIDHLLESVNTDTIRLSKLSDVSRYLSLANENKVFDKSCLAILLHVKNLFGII